MIKTFEGFKSMWDDITMKSDRDELKNIKFQKTDEYKKVKKTITDYWLNNHRKDSFHTKRQINELIEKVMLNNKDVENLLSDEYFYNIILDDLHDFFN